MEGGDDAPGARRGGTHRRPRPRGAHGRFDEDVWELYHLADDFSEAHDLAAEHPEKLAELQELWWEDASVTTCCRSTTG